jgi:hypothetical protein
MTDTITLPRAVVERIREALMVATTPIPADRHTVKAALDTLDAALAEPDAKRDAKHPGYITAAKMEHQLRITCGFVDVQFDGEKWFCAKCSERMPANYEALVKHYSGERDYLKLMQRKAEAIRARGSK